MFHSIRIFVNGNRLTVYFSKDYFFVVVDCVWSSNDIITGDYMPYIGPLDAKDKTFLIATGYNTWGMTNATLAGELIADILNDQENEYENLFSPTRLGLSKIISVVIARPFQTFSI